MIYPGVAQMVARLLWEQDAAGSNPVTRTMGESLCDSPIFYLINLLNDNCQSNWYNKIKIFNEGKGIWDV